jgi:hypothetical protein
MISATCLFHLTYIFMFVKQKINNDDAPCKMQCRLGQTLIANYKHLCYGTLNVSLWGTL